MNMQAIGIKTTKRLTRLILGLLSVQPDSAHFVTDMDHMVGKAYEYDGSRLIQVEDDANEDDECDEDEDVDENEDDLNWRSHHHKQRGCR